MLGLLLAVQATSSSLRQVAACRDNLNRRGIRGSRRLSSSAAAAFLPTQLQGCILWLRPDPGTYTIATGISRLNDLSSAGNNATQATGSAQPTLNASDAAYGNQPTMSFVGASSQQLLRLSMVGSNSQPVTMIVIGNTSLVSSGLVTFNTAEMFCDSSSTIKINAGTALSSSTSAASPCIMAAVFNSTSQLYVNSSLAPAVSGSAGSSGFGTGTLVVGQGAGAQLTGKIAEVILYNGAPPLGPIFRYAGQRYGFPTWG